MRGLTRRWMLQDFPTLRHGASAADLPLFERLLHARGLGDPAQARVFCDPKLTDLSEPSQIPGCAAAAQRLARAVREGEKIAIYGDYDVDGVSAMAILYHVILATRPDATLRTYVPHRLDEGYGINSEALRQLHAEGVTLVVSVDCGITAREPARVARELGLDLVVTDHHNLPEEGRLPRDAVVVVHPRLERTDWPGADLCGAGVAFKLAWQFAIAWCGSARVSANLQRVLLEMLPLAALGTIADVVPLRGENRIIARHGLRLIKQTPIEGLRALIEVSDLMDEKIDCEKVGFVLGPRLNACGRMGHAAEAVTLLTTARGQEAIDLATRLASLNAQRQATERAIFEQACRMAEDSGMTRDDCRIIVLADPLWHAGVVGIVCSRLVEKYGRPAILLQSQGDVCKGSARSCAGYSIHEALTASSSHLETYGGHDVAAGLTVRADSLRQFTKELIEHANARISADMLTPQVRIDCDALVHELEAEVVHRISALSPFGRENPRPLVRLRDLTLSDPPRQIGSQGSHLSLNLRQDSPQGRRYIRGVWWNQGALAAELAAGMPLDAVIEPKLNDWNGRVSVEAEIKDVRIVERAIAVGSNSGASFAAKR